MGLRREDKEHRLSSLARHVSETPSCTVYTLMASEPYMCGLWLVLLPIQKTSSWGRSKVSQREETGRTVLQASTETQANLVSNLRGALKCTHRVTVLRMAAASGSFQVLSFRFTLAACTTSYRLQTWFDCRKHDLLAPNPGSLPGMLAGILGTI